MADCLTAIGDKYKEKDIDIYKEKISGYSENEKRLELSKMLAVIEKDNKAYDSVYVTEISRLGRSPSQVRKLIDYLSDLKIPIYFTSIKQSSMEHGERSSSMNIMLQVLIEFANAESITMKRRSRSGILQNAKTGGAGGSVFFPMGYKKSADKKLVIDDDEAIIVKEIFDLYLSGQGCNWIASHLNERGIPTRTNKAFGDKVLNFNRPKQGNQIKWSDKTVLGILRNSIYKGHRKFRGDKINEGEEYDGPTIKNKKNEHFKTLILDAPVIISPQLFDACNDIINTKTHRNSLTDYPYLLKDLVRCGVCGRNMFAKYRPIKGGDKAYICSSRLHQKGNCGNIGVHINYIESVVYDMLIGQKILMNRIDQSDEMIPTVTNEIENITKKLSLEESEMSKLKKSMEKLNILFRETDMTLDEYKTHAENDDKALKSGTKRIDLLNKNLQEQKDILFKITNKSKDADFLNKLSKDRPEIITIFKQFIKTIYITKMPAGGDVLLDIHLKISNNKPSSTLKIIIDSFISRYKRNAPFTYRLLTTPEILITKYDADGVLINTSDEVYTAFSLPTSKYLLTVPAENVMEL